eukprot:scaffold33922_cov34-Tisochrysis_lutea.AAC.2
MECPDCEGCAGCGCGCGGCCGFCAAAWLSAWRPSARCTWWCGGVLWWLLCPPGWEGRPWCGRFGDSGVSMNTSSSAAIAAAAGEGGGARSMTISVY